MIIARETLRLYVPSTLFAAHALHVRVVSELGG